MPERTSLERFLGVDVTQLSPNQVYASSYPSKVLVPNPKFSDTDKYTNSLDKALASQNNPVAILGLNISPAILPPLTLENWHENVQHDNADEDQQYPINEWLDGPNIAVVISSPWALIAIIPYLLLAAWNWQITVLKHILYYENETRYLNQLKAFKDKYGALYVDKNINEKEFNKKFENLNLYYDSLSTWDPYKRFLRAVLIFGIIFASLAALATLFMPILIVSIVPVLALALICAAVITYFEKNDLNKDITQELNLKKLEWELLEHKKAYAQAIENDIAINYNYKVGDYQALITVKPYELKIPYILADHAGNIIGVSNTYVIFGFITLFGIGILILEANLALLLIIPAVLVLGFGCYIAYNNQQHFYNDHEEKINESKKLNSILQQEINEIEIKLGLPTSTLSHVPQQHAYKALENLAWNVRCYIIITEALKKLIRPIQFLGLFGAFSLILGASFAFAAGGWVIIAAIAVVAIILCIGEGFSRYYKGELTSQASKERELQGDLYEKKASLLIQYKEKTKPSQTINTNATSGNFVGNPETTNSSPISISSSIHDYVYNNKFKTAVGFSFVGAAIGGLVTYKRLVF